MFEDSYIIAITALLPLTAFCLVFQVNPYQALVVRGILGAIAALVYALFGAADVALTEALVGTMLSITLYAIAVRSSMSLRLGVLCPEGTEPEQLPAQVLSGLHSVLDKHHLRLEQVVYPTPAALKAALAAQEIHTAYGLDEAEAPCFHTRLRPLHDILQAELSASARLVHTAPTRQPEPYLPPETTTLSTEGQP